MSSENAYEIHPGTLYDYTAGIYCGVLVTEKVMRKLAALQAKHLEEVTRLLTDSEGEVFPSMWTLHYPAGEQTHVHYIDPTRTAAEAIKYARTANPPRAVHPVFRASGMEDARRMADARHAEMNPPTPCPECRENECNGECMEPA